MKKVFAIVVLGFALMTTSCISTLVSSVAKSQKVGNKMVFHKNPRIGDYAVYKGSDGKTRSTFRVVGKRHGLYVVQNDTGFEVAGNYMSALLLEIHVDKYGNVRKAFVIDGAQKNPMVIAKKGDPEYITVKKLSSQQRKELDIPKKVTVPAGTFRVTPLVFSSVNKGRDSLTVNLVSRKAKFGHVEALTFYNNDGVLEEANSLKLVEQGNSR